MEPSTFSPAQQLQATLRRHRKKILVILLVLLLTAGLLRFFISFNIVYISVANIPQGIDVKTVEIAGGDGLTFKKIGSQGLKILPTDIDMVRITAGKTIAQQIPIRMPWYRVASISADLQNSNRAVATSFLSTMGSSCAVYNSSIHQLTGYPCLNASRLLSQEKIGQNWQTVATDTFSYISGAGAPYKDGVIGALYSEQHRASVGVKAVGGEGVVYKLPSEITYEDLRANPIVTDSAHPDNSRFVVIAQSGDIYIATPNDPEAPVTYKKYPAPKGYDAKTQQTRCTLNGEMAHCYRGLRLQGDQELNEMPSISNTVSKYSATTDTEQTWIVNEPMAEAIYATSDGTVYLQKYTDLFQATERSESLQLHKVAQQVQSVSAGDELRFISNQGVYQFNSKSEQAHQIFYSSNIKPVRIYTAGSKTFVFGSTGDFRQTMYGYELLAQPYDEKAPRLVDLFPANADSLPGVTSQRLIGNELYVSFAAPISKTTPPTAGTNDIVEQRRRAVEEAIEAITAKTDENVEIRYSF